MERVLRDAELIGLSMREPAAFGELYDRHGPAVLRYVTRRVGSADGEDLAAEVFVRAFRSRERYRPERGYALPWLLGIANHVVADHRRIERRRLATLERLTAEDRQQSESREAGLALEVVRALRALPAVERDTLLLVVWGEVSRDEAAAALEVPVGTVNSRIARARKRLSADLTLAVLSPTTAPRLTGGSSV